MMLAWGHFGTCWYFPSNKAPNCAGRSVWRSISPKAFGLKLLMVVSGLTLYRYWSGTWAPDESTCQPVVKLSLFKPTLYTKKLARQTPPWIWLPGCDPPSELLWPHGPLPKSTMFRQLFWPPLARLRRSPRSVTCHPESAMGWTGCGSGLAGLLTCNDLKYNISINIDSNNTKQTNETTKSTIAKNTANTTTTKTTKKSRKYQISTRVTSARTQQTQQLAKGHHWQTTKNQNTKK